MAESKYAFCYDPIGFHPGVAEIKHLTGEGAPDASPEALWEWHAAGKAAMEAAMRGHPETAYVHNMAPYIGNVCTLGDLKSEGVGLDVHNKWSQKMIEENLRDRGITGLSPRANPM